MLGAAEDSRTTNAVVARTRLSLRDRAWRLVREDESAAEGRVRSGGDALAAIREELPLPEWLVEVSVLAGHREMRDGRAPEPPRRR
jgi:hypothetical protein